MTFQNASRVGAKLIYGRILFSRSGTSTKKVYLLDPNKLHHFVDQDSDNSDGCSAASYAEMREIEFRPWQAFRVVETSDKKSQACR